MRFTRAVRPFFDNQIMEKKRVFLTDDIHIQNVDMSEEYEAYEFTENIDDFLRHVIDYSKKAKKGDKSEAKALLSQFEADAPSTVSAIREWIGEHDSLYQEWTDGVTQEEQYQVPMMYAVRFYPDFVSFDEEDRYKTSGATTLLYDRENDRWGVAMTGGGMDLAPHLLDTFVQLEKGVPTELASFIRRDYNAYVNNDRHIENCTLLAEAYAGEAIRSLDKYLDLMGEMEKADNPMTRHIKGIEKTLKSR